MVDLESSELRSRHILHTIDESCYESNETRPSKRVKTIPRTYYLRWLLPLQCQVGKTWPENSNILFVLTLGKYHNIILHMGVS